MVGKKPDRKFSQIKGNAKAISIATIAYNFSYCLWNKRFPSEMTLKKE